MLALLVPQMVEAGASSEAYLTSVDRAEELTGIHFFSDLEDGMEDSLESDVPARMW